MGSYLLSVFLTLYVQFGGSFKELRQIFFEKVFYNEKALPFSRVKMYSS